MLQGLYCFNTFSHNDIFIPDKTHYVILKKCRNCYYKYFVCYHRRNVATQLIKK